jgi:hypothetical protein
VIDTVKKSIEVLAPVSLYALSLGAIGYGTWMVGGGDWRGLGFAVVGAFLWVDLLLASRAAVAARKRPRDKA